jgi:hypothetical protein
MVLRLCRLFLFLSVASFLVGCFFSWTGGTRRAVWLRLPPAVWLKLSPAVWLKLSPAVWLKLSPAVWLKLQTLAACFGCMLSDL